MKLLVAAVLLVAVIAETSCQTEEENQCFAAFFQNANNTVAASSIGLDCNGVIQFEGRVRWDTKQVLECYIVVIQSNEEIRQDVCSNMDTDCFRSLEALYRACNFDVDAGN